MKLPNNIPVFGDISYRGDCKKELLEQIDFYQWLKFNHPKYARMFIHLKNEGKKTGRQVASEKRDGSMNPGVSDCVIIAKVPFCVELKRRDHKKSRLPKDELDFLESAQELGCFVGVALGADGLKEAFNEWLNIMDSP